MKPLKGLVWQAFWISLVLLGVVSLAFSQAAPPAGAVRPVGAVKAVNANGLTITTDAGTDMNIEVPAGTKIVQVAAGQKDLKSATPIQLSDIKPGDRVLARGAASADGKTVTATSLIVMKQSDIAERQQQERRLAEARHWWIGNRGRPCCRNRDHLAKPGQNHGGAHIKEYGHSAILA